MSITRFINWLTYHGTDRCPEVSVARWNGMLNWYAARVRASDFPVILGGLSNVLSRL